MHQGFAGYGVLIIARQRVISGRIESTQADRLSPAAGEGAAGHGFPQIVKKHHSLGLRFVDELQGAAAGFEG